MNEDIIEKPSSVAKEEFISKLVDLVNNASLPLFVIEYILKDFVIDIHTASSNQAAREKQEYLYKMNQLKEAEDDK